MRNLIKLASIGVLAVGLTACGKKPKDTTDPGGGGGDGGGTAGGNVAGGANPKAATAEAKADFQAAVKTYLSAKSDGKISGDECERVASGFQRVYKQHGVQMAIAQFNAGVVYEECGQADKAEPIYSGLTSSAPKFDLAYNNLGVIYWKKGQDAKALEMFKKGVEANKLSARAARNNVAGLMRNQYVTNTDLNVFNEAQTAIQGVLALDSGNQAAYENLARIYYDRGHLKDKSYLVLADLVVTQGLRVLKTDNKESSDILNIKGLLLLEKDNQVDALKTFKESVRVEPSHVEANLNIGFISIRFRDYATAESAFNTALKAPSVQKNIEVWLALGVAQRGLKKFKEAEASYNKAKGLSANDPRPWFNLGVLYQDHLSTQDGVDPMKEGEKLVNTAKGHYNKFISTAAGNKVYTTRVLEAKDRIATIEQTIEFNKISAELEKKAAEMAKVAAAQEAEERKRLLELEKQAMDAENGSGENPAPPAGGAAPPVAAPKK